MPFQQSQLTKSVNQTQDIFDEYIYRPTNGDELEDILSDNYFAASRFVGEDSWIGSLLTFFVGGGLYNARIAIGSVVLLTGTPGADSISSFPNLETMNAYFVIDDHYKDLHNDDNVTVTVDDVVFQYIWRGVSSPTEYDPLLWERAEIGTTAGSLIMGPASIESAAQVLMYKDATGGSNYVIQSFFDAAGSKAPIYYELSAESIFDLALVDTDVLTAPMKSETVMTFQSMSDAFICKPASAGVLVYKTWIGTESSHADQPILNERVEITSAMVGVETKVPIKNPVIINQDESLYSEITGVDLYGGLQDAGPMIGQTVPFNKLHLQTVTQRFIALADETASDLAVTTTSTSMTITNTNGTDASIPLSSNTKAGLMSANGNIKVNGIEAEAQVNDNQVKVRGEGTPNFLEGLLKAGDNIELDVTDDDITISATGGGPVDIGGIVVGDIYKSGLRFNTPANKNYVIPQVEYHDSDNTMSAPFFYNKGTGVKETYLSRNRVDTNAIQVKDNGYNQIMDGYNGQPINEMTIKVGGNHSGVKFSLHLFYTNADGRPSSVYTESITCTNAVQELTVSLNSSIVMVPNVDASIRVGANYSSSDVVELMGETGGFAEKLWIDWSAENVGGETKLATENEILPTINSDAGTSSWTSLTGKVDRYSGTPPAGLYRVDYSCNVRIGTPASTGLGYFQMNVAHGGSISSTALCQVSAGVSSTSYDYGSVSGVDYVQLSGSELLEISISASNYTSVTYRWNSCYITRLGN